MISLTSISYFQCYPGDFLLSCVYIFIAACFPVAIYAWVKHWRHAMCSRLIVQTEKKSCCILEKILIMSSEQTPKSLLGFTDAYLLTQQWIILITYMKWPVKCLQRDERRAEALFVLEAFPLLCVWLLAGWHSGFSYSPESWRSQVQFFAQPCVEVALSRTLKYTPTRWLWGWRQRMWLSGRFISNLSISTVVGKSGSRLEVEVQTAQPPSSLRRGLET